MTLALDEALEVPRSGLLRSHFITAEGEYWRQTHVSGSFLASRDAGGEITEVKFSPSPKRIILAAGTRGGGVLAWQMGGHTFGQACGRRARCPSATCRVLHPANGCTMAERAA